MEQENYWVFRETWRAYYVWVSETMRELRDKWVNDRNQAYHDDGSKIEANYASRRVGLSLKARNYFPLKIIV